MKHYIVVKRTVTIIERVPYTENHYPGTKAIEDAVDFEKNQDFSTKIEDFMMVLDGAEEIDIELVEEITTEEI